MRAKHHEWVGLTITTKRGTDLQVVSHNGKTGNHSKHLFCCPECAKDPVLFGNGCFWGSINHVLNGSIPCGCSKSPAWTEEQNRVRCQREANKKGLVFHGWAEKYRGKGTRIILCCQYHGRIGKATISTLVHQSHGCIECRYVSARKESISDRDAEKKYLHFCGYPEGATLKRLGAPGEKGKRDRFLVFCPVCANDEYAQMGLCHGVFQTTTAALSRGAMSCRCSGTSKRPESIARYQCESILEDSNLEFLGWLDGYKNRASLASVRCKTHGVYSAPLHSILRGSQCPSCNSGGGYDANKGGQIYLLESECQTLMKVGISNNFKKRMAKLLKRTPFAFRVCHVKNMQGSAAPILERKILSQSVKAGLSGFDGATEWVFYDDSLRDHFW